MKTIQIGSAVRVEIETRNLETYDLRFVICGSKVEFSPGGILQMLRAAACLQLVNDN